MLLVCLLDHIRHICVPFTKQKTVYQSYIHFTQLALNVWSQINTLSTPPRFINPIEHTIIVHCMATTKHMERCWKSQKVPPPTHTHTRTHTHTPPPPPTPPATTTNHHHHQPPPPTHPPMSTRPPTHVHPPMSTRPHVSTLPRHYIIDINPRGFAIWDLGISTLTVAMRCLL